MEELDVDYIGGKGSLTESEEKALSEFFKKRRLAIQINPKIINTEY